MILALLLTLLACIALFCIGVVALLILAVAVVVARLLQDPP